MPFSVNFVPSTALKVSPRIAILQSLQVLNTVISHNPTAESQGLTNTGKPQKRNNLVSPRPVRRDESNGVRTIATRRPPPPRIDDKGPLTEPNPSVFTEPNPVTLCALCGVAAQHTATPPSATTENRRIKRREITEPLTSSYVLRQCQLPTRFALSARTAPAVPIHAPPGGIKIAQKTSSNHHTLIATHPSSHICLRLTPKSQITHQIQHVSAHSAPDRPFPAPFSQENLMGQCMGHA